MWYPTLYDAEEAKVYKEAFYRRKFKIVDEVTKLGKDDYETKIYWVIREEL